MQFTTFLICVVCGFIGGIIYEPIYIIRTAICGAERVVYNKKDTIITAIFDVLFFVLFGVLFSYFAVAFNFYEARLYTFLGCALGFYVYIKTLHYTLAFLVRKVYNKVKNKKRVRKRAYDRRKAQSNSGGNNH